MAIGAGHPGGIVIHTERPEWITREVAEQMRDQVLAAVKEAGYPAVVAYERSGDDWYFVGAPRDVIEKAGHLVRVHWGIED